MTLVCVPIAVEDVTSALRDGGEARDVGADLIEWRIDGFVSDAPSRSQIESVARLVESSPLPCILTCRHASEGGAFDGTASARSEFLEGVFAAGATPRYVDLELALLQPRPELPADTSLIVSLHDFDGRPIDLNRRLSTMRNIDEASILKVAYRARSLRDNLELFELMLESDRPMIGIGMGEFGLPSRVLAPKYGGFLTFASLRDSEATAPGQPTVRELFDLYRFARINADTRVYGVAGWPVSHSLSPLVHNAGFGESGHNGVYVPLPIPPEYEHFKATVGAFVDHPLSSFAGASVTIPHKEHLAQLAAESGDWLLDETVRQCGAANTLHLDDDAVRVLNTDSRGVIGPLTETLGTLDGKRVLVLGAGGAARAAAAGALASGARVTIANRTAKRARELAATIDPSGATSGINLEDAGSVTCDALVNCTSVGMASGPAPNESPISFSEWKNRGESFVVLDSVYAPLRTPLLQEAEEAGCRTIDGLRMFVEQAEAQFERWTGERAPTGLYERLCRGALDDSA